MAPGGALPDSAAFEPLVGDTFDLMAADERASARLDSCTVHQHSASAESFTLVFTAPLAERPQQAIYGLEHPTLGALELFLVPVGVSDDGYQLEAVCNLVPTAQEA